MPLGGTLEPVLLRTATIGEHATNRQMQMGPTPIS
jgi:hypothetical protein